MAVNNPHGHNQYTKKKNDGASSESKQMKSGSAGGTRGGTSEQHAEAGRQSHKNDERSGASKQQR